MSTKRSKNKITEIAGITYIQGVVQVNNCIFQSVAMENDQGNDCYIEFISNNVATSFCVFAQIKSGQSYKTASGYKIPTDKDHLEYWSNALVPIVGIVYDDILNKAFWINITEYLKTHPEAMRKKTHSIEIHPESEFSNDTFEYFKTYFCDYINEYKNYENYGRSLEQFSMFEDSYKCNEGAKSLYSNHRDKTATWFYLVSNFGNVIKESIHRNLLGIISNNLDNPYVFWHSDNMKYLPAPGIKEYIPDLVGRYFGKKEIKLCIPFMREGVVRGSFPFLVYMVLNLTRDIDNILSEMAFDENVDADERTYLFWLFIHFSQKRSITHTLNMIEYFLKTFPDGDENYLIEGMRDTLKEQGFIDIG